MAGIYIHIPFCKQACNYCDFHFSTSLKMKDEFIQALIHEIELRKDMFSQETISSIYFGGGTPSLLSQNDLHVIFEKLYSSFKINSDIEITLESNPDDLSYAKIEQLKKSLINRISIGVQSFKDSDLQFMNRAHTAKEALDSVKNCQDSGFTNLNIDLIYGTPGMTDQDWLENLNTSFTLNVPHISSYALTVEKNTALYKQIQKNKLDPINEQQSIKQFEILMSEMDGNSYEQYEISNFCKANYYSKHNTSYWKRNHYLGLGPSAHSFYENSRFWNVSNNMKYIKELGEDKLPYEKEVLSLMDQYNEYVMTSLRTKWGCNINYIHDFFSFDFSNHFKLESRQYIIDKRLIEINGIYYLTTKGKLFADQIASDLFLVKH